MHDALNRQFNVLAFGAHPDDLELSWAAPS